MQSRAAPSVPMSVLVTMLLLAYVRVTPPTGVNTMPVDCPIPVAIVARNNHMNQHLNTVFMVPVNNEYTGEIAIWTA